MIQVDRDLRFIFEHVDELGAVGVLGKDALDREELSDATGTRSAREKDFGHTTGSQLLEEHIFTKAFKLR